MPHFRAKWNGPWDGPGRAVRILTLTADNKEHAERLLSVNFPAIRRHISLIRQPRKERRMVTKYRNKL